MTAHPHRAHREGRPWPLALVACGALALMALLGITPRTKTSSNARPQPARWTVPTEPATSEEALAAARLEHKLGYLSADYAMSATSTGASDDGESEEHARLATEIERLLPEGATAEVVRAVALASKLVRQSASAAAVEAATQRARVLLVSRYGLPVAPAAPPDLLRGKVLFEAYCATCHGEAGNGETARAAALKPRPANFLDPSVGEPLSPYRVTTTVRFGVDGTAMAPFGFLSEAARWDVAFYVMSLRHVTEPVAAGPAVGLDVVARSSDAELRGLLRTAGVPEPSVEPAVTALRRGTGEAAAGVTLARSAVPKSDADGSVAPPSIVTPGTPLLPCSGEGYSRGPEPRAQAGQPGFSVLFDCLWPSRQRLEIAVTLARAQKRAAVEGLLRALWKDLGVRMGKDLPETIKLCVHAPRATLSDPPLGCIREGYEPEGEPGEEEGELRIEMPPEPDEVAQRVKDGYAGRFPGSLSPRVAIDGAGSELSVVYPYVEEKSDRWTPEPTLAEIALPLFTLAWDFFPPKSALSGLRFEGVWRGKTLVRVHLKDTRAFLDMQPWALRDRLQAAAALPGSGAPLSAEQRAILQRELSAALARLPLDAVHVDASVL